MATLVVPDIHELYEKLVTKIAPLIPKYDRTIFLGDWFDTFGEHYAESICGWLRDNYNNPKITFVMGNHDAHYRWRNHQFQCSGWNAKTARIVESRLEPKHWAPFVISTVDHEWRLSHAGYHPLTIKRIHSESDALLMADNGDFHPLFDIGISRGGWATVGGPLWLDFNYEFDPVPNMKQIVGHTVQFKKIPAQNDGNFCLDTGLRHIGLIDDDGNFKYSEI